MLWGGIFCYTNAMETRKHRLFSVKCCVNARWRQWCCWQARKPDEQSTLSPEIGVIATLRSVSSPLAPTPPYSSNTFQKEVWSAFPGSHHLYPFEDAHKKWVSFLLLQMGIQALLISALFFFFFPAFRNTSFLKCSSDLQIPHTKAVNGFRLRFLRYL